MTSLFSYGLSHFTDMGSPFGEQTAKGQIERRNCTLRINLKRQEKELLKQAEKEHEDGQCAVFVRAFLFKVLEKMEGSAEPCRQFFSF